MTHGAPPVKPAGSKTSMPRQYRWVVGALRLVVRAFFREVVVSGLENIPPEGGGIVVSWHPNGLIDPALIITTFPRQIVFGARHGIFRWPLLGQLMRAVGTVPIFRARDLPNMSKTERAAANAKSLSALANAIAAGSVSALFPEGHSHDAPHLINIKTGAARLFHQAQRSTPANAPPPVVIPVGLHYDDKDLFRSNAMVEYHPPISLSPSMCAHGDCGPEEQRQRVRALTLEIERVLHDVVLATESWHKHHLMHRARTLIRAERSQRAGRKLNKPNVEERTLGFARIRAGYQQRVKEQPEAVRALLDRVEDYHQDLQALQIRDHELDHAPRWLSATLVVGLVFQVLTVFLIAPPVLLVGYVVNAPGAGLLWLLGRMAAKEKKDEATIKLLVGALLFPLSWLAAGIGAAMVHRWLHGLFPTIPDTPVLAGFTVAALAAAGGASAVRYQRVAGETARAVRVRMTRRLQRRALARLRVERADLHDALIGMAAGVTLPGEVLDDGRIVRD